MLIQEHVQHKSKTWIVLISRLGSGHLVFQRRLKGAGKAIAMHKEVAAGIIILADSQVVMSAEIR